MLMPTGFEYIEEMNGSDFFYGATIAAFPTGRICFLMLFGYWSDRRGFRTPFCVANILAIVGMILYGIASSCHSKWFALVGRFIAGTGATHPLSAWAAEVYPPEKRLRIETLQKSCALLGVIIGPALNACVVNMNWQFGFIDLNPRTCAGYVPAVLYLILLFGFLLGVDEPRERQARVSAPWSRMVNSGVWVCLFIVLQINLQVAALDTILAPLASKLLEWGLLANSAMFAVLALISLLGAVFGILAEKAGVKIVRLILYGQIANTVLVTIFSGLLWRGRYEMNIEAVMAISSVNMFSIMMYIGATGALFQHACSGAQGLLGGLFNIAFASGRPIGALVAGAFLDGHPVPLCVSVVCGVAISLCLHILLYRRLQCTEEAAMHSSDETSLMAAHLPSVDKSSPQ